VDSQHGTVPASEADTGACACMPVWPSLLVLTGAHKANADLQMQHDLIVLCMINEGTRADLSICVLLLSFTRLLQITRVFT